MKRLALLIILTTSLSVSQVRAVRTYGSPKSDHAEGIAAMHDSGYVILGHTDKSAAGDVDFLVMRIDKYGAPLWTQTFGTSGNDYGDNICLLADGSILALGWSQKPGGGDIDMLLARISDQGTLHWKKVYGGSGNECAYYGTQLRNGNISVVGYTSSGTAGGNDAILLIIDMGGNVLSETTYNNGGTDAFAFVAEMPGGNLLATGWTQVSGGFASWLLKTSASGIPLASRTVNTNSNNDFQSVVLSRTGDLFVVGTANPTGTSADIIVCRTDTNLGIVWTKRFGGSYADYAYHAFEAADGDIVVLGTTKVSLNSSDCYMMKLTSTGDIRWQRVYGGVNTEETKMGALSAAGGYALAGWTSSFGSGSDDVLLILTDSLGTSGCVDAAWNTSGQTFAYSTSSSLPSTQLSFGVLPIIISSRADLLTSGIQCLSLVSVSPPGQGTSPIGFNLNQNYPNPFNPETVIEFEASASGWAQVTVYNELGQTVYGPVDRACTAGKNTLVWSAKGLPSGPLFLQVKQGGRILQKKMMYLK